MSLVFALFLTFFPELAFVLVFVHRLGGPSVLAARAGELAGDQGARAVVPQVVVEVAALQNLAAGVRVRARHHLLVEEPESKGYSAYPKDYEERAHHSLQGDRSGCAKHPVDIKVKVPFLYEVHVQKQNFCFVVNGRFCTN